MKLSEHFTLQECTFSRTAKMRGIDNTPNAEQTDNMRRLCDRVLEPIRNYYALPFRPSSVFRSHALNVAVGGSSTSDHLTGNAADIEIAGVANIDLAHWCADNLDFDQLILEYAEHWRTDTTDGWVHISYRGDRNRREELTIDRSGRRYGLPNNDS